MTKDNDLHAANDDAAVLRDVEHDLELITERLEDQFAGIDSEVVDDVVHECAARFDHAPVQNFVYLLTEKAARQQLRAAIATSQPVD